MSIPNKIRFYLPLMLISLICLNSCATTDYNYCPVYPIAGAEVAESIEQIENPEFWEWLARINKLRQQLELCKK